MKSPCRALTGLFIIILAVGAGAPGSSRADDTKYPKPKLAVILVFDQMRGDYLQKWKDLFGEGGFKRLQTDGAWFTNCHYPYSDTVTSAGHTSLVTGTSPYRHGIIGNEWYDRGSGEAADSTASERYDPVPPAPPGKKGKRSKGGSPLRRREETIGDVILRASQGKAKIGSLSIKEHAAVLMAALRAHFVYWFSTSTGNFGTSTYYNDTLHSWIKDFNSKHLGDRWFGKDWTPFRTRLDYAKYSGRDDVEAEGIGYGQGRTFPHPMSGGLTKVGSKYYSALTNSPYGNELLLELVKTAIVAEKMGQGDQTDLLTVSFSSNDTVGHCWGPDSQEVLDITLRSDLILKQLLDFLDVKVGKGQYVVLLSADHGVCSIPEVSKSHGKDAGRIAPEALRSGGEAHLQMTLAKDGNKRPWIENMTGSWFYFNKGTLRELGLPSSTVEKTLATWLSKQPGVEAAFIRSEIEGKPPLTDPIAESVRRSFYPERSGDVKVLLKPYYLFGGDGKKSAAYATTHGSPYDYDTHVPLLAYGPGLRPGVHAERVAPQALATILARLLDVPLPSGDDTPLPKGVLMKE